MPPVFYYYIGEEGNLFQKGLYHYCYRVFIPEEPEMQEQFWLGLVIRTPEESYKHSRSYFIYSKSDIIFYTDQDLSKTFEHLPDEEYRNPWSLKRIFFGEPFISPIDTSRWKILGRNLRGIGK
ncbi:MAG: hypothetical protein AB1599_06845 [Planctomycetota bacterium]